MAVLGTVVEWGDVLEVIWTAALAGVAVTGAFAVAILGATRAVDLRRDGHAAAAGVYAVVGAVALAVVAGGVVLGIITMTSK